MEWRRRREWTWNRLCTRIRSDDVNTTEWIDSRIADIRRRTLLILADVKAEADRAARWLHDGDVPVGHVEGLANQLREAAAMMQVLRELVELRGIAEVKVQ